jgi:hypothetical protein
MQNSDCFSAKTHKGKTSIYIYVKISLFQHAVTAYFRKFLFQIAGMNTSIGNHLTVDF